MRVASARLWDNRDQCPAVHASRRAVRPILRRSLLSVANCIRWLEAAEQDRKFNAMIIYGAAR